MSATVGLFDSFYILRNTWGGGIAQGFEHWPTKPRVVSSIPEGAIKGTGVKIWGWSCLEQGVGLDDLLRSLLTLIVYDSMICLPTCLLCTCLGTTVYCDDHELDAVPPLPKKTTHFYSRYNRIKKINKNDFANQNNLKRIDLTSNFISEIDEDAFRELPQLQELVLRDNKIRQLPELPPSLTFIDVSNNRLGRKGIKEEAFKDMVDLHHLYITDNNLDHIPLPLPESLQALHLQNNNIQEMHEDTFCKMKDVTYARRALEDIRLDGNPINLSKTPSAYMCLPRLPIGSLI
uniref:LRRNT domain-containing protein n=1 Tax=Gopherus agassizii TaxID=38772 RepID=A0A452I1W0_9SAUR